MLRLIRVFAWRTSILLVSPWDGSSNGNPVMVNTSAILINCWAICRVHRQLRINYNFFKTTCTWPYLSVVGITSRTSGFLLLWFSNSIRSLICVSLLLWEDNLHVWFSLLIGANNVQNEYVANYFSTKGGYWLSPVLWQFLFLLCSVIVKMLFGVVITLYCVQPRSISPSRWYLRSVIYDCDRFVILLCYFVSSLLRNITIN